ncbi:MAG: hypothetical protein ACI32N_06855 [Bulleidia sp.]
MFEFLKRKKKEKKEELEEQPVVQAQKAEHGFYVGMYCPVCGYMEVNMESNELPLEGFAHCPNCGDQMVRGYFTKDEVGFHLAVNAENLIRREEKHRVSGGHYRVRGKGPGKRDRAVIRRMFF